MRGQVTVVFWLRLRRARRQSQITRSRKAATGLEFMGTA
jgi:hypothetical protein